MLIPGGWNIREIDHWEPREIRELREKRKSRESRDIQWNTEIHRRTHITDTGKVWQHDRYGSEVDLGERNHDTARDIMEVEREIGEFWKLDNRNLWCDTADHLEHEMLEIVALIPAHATSCIEIREDIEEELPGFENLRDDRPEFLPLLHTHAVSGNPSPLNLLDRPDITKEFLSIALLEGHEFFELRGEFLVAIDRIDIILNLGNDIIRVDTARGIHANLAHERFRIREVAIGILSAEDRNIERYRTVRYLDEWRTSEKLIGGLHPANRSVEVRDKSRIWIGNRGRIPNPIDIIEGFLESCLCLIGIALPVFVDK